MLSIIRTVLDIINGFLSIYNAHEAAVSNPHNVAKENDKKFADALACNDVAAVNAMLNDVQH
jgi:hypothetical protein